MKFIVDTSVWISHLHKTDKQLSGLLEDGAVIIHPAVIGELSCGTLKNRTDVLSNLKLLPSAVEASHEECLGFIENHKLFGKGLSYFDVQLLTSSLLSDAAILTRDKGLGNLSERIGRGS